MAPTLELFLEIDCVDDPLELSGIYELQGSTRMRIRGLVRPSAMFVVATSDIVRDADVERSVKTLEHVDVIGAHGERSPRRIRVTRDRAATAIVAVPRIRSG